MKVPNRTTRALTCALLICLLAPVGVALAEDPPAAPVAAPPANPLSAHSKSLYRGVRMILLRSAENMPEEKYGFKPTEAVRSFGQIVGHVADAQYLFCSAVRGEQNPSLKIEKTMVTKADLVAALRDAVAYCDEAYDDMTDTSGVELVKFMGSDKPKLGVLSINQVHSIEHYGNLVTYMRMNDLVPPTSDPEFMKSLNK